MNKCKKIREKFSQAFYDELPDTENKIFNNHLSECHECHKEFSNLKSVLHTMDKKSKPELTPDYWERYWDKIENRIEKSETSSPIIERWRNKIFSNYRFDIKWIYQTVGAVAILLFGIFIGRFYLSSGDNEQQVVNYTEQPSTLTNVELTNRTSNYLQRSKILILGLVNFDPQLDDADAINIPQQKQISRELIVEANYLKNQLDGTQQQ